MQPNGPIFFSGCCSSLSLTCSAITFATVANIHLVETGTGCDPVKVSRAKERHLFKEDYGMVTQIVSGDLNR